MCVVMVGGAGVKGGGCGGGGGRRGGGMHDAKRLRECRRRGAARATLQHERTALRWLMQTTAGCTRHLPVLTGDLLITACGWCWSACGVRGWHEGMGDDGRTLMDKVGWC
jgi:hypothetical protein